MNLQWIPLIGIYFTLTTKNEDSFANPMNKLFFPSIIYQGLSLSVAFALVLVLLA